MKHLIEKYQNEIKALLVSHNVEVINDIRNEYDRTAAQVYDDVIDDLNSEQVNSGNISDKQETKPLHIHCVTWLA
jgi:hypothetical protein